MHLRTTGRRGNLYSIFSKKSGPYGPGNRVHCLTIHVVGELIQQIHHTKLLGICLHDCLSWEYRLYNKKSKHCHIYFKYVLESIQILCLWQSPWNLINTGNSQLSGGGLIGLCNGGSFSPPPPLCDVHGPQELANMLS
jgi:hypothetical protein